MTNEHSHVDKEQLRYEVELVEKILSLAKDQATLHQAGDLSVELLKTQKTNTFDAINICEYVAFLYDIQRLRREHNIEGENGAKEDANTFLKDVLNELEQAKSILQN
jgi:hypothetical protein